MIAYEASRPVTGTASRGAKLFQKQVIEKKIKKVNASKKIAKKAAKDTARNVAKKAAKETTKEVGKVVAKETTKVAASVAATAAGTTVAPGVGTAIGIAAGYATGVAIEQQDAKIMNRNRKLKFFLDKMQAQENQQDSLAKLVKDLIFRQVMVWVKAVAPIVGLALLLMVLIVAIVAIPVIAVVAVMYNSPFALFLPPLDDGDTVTTVASAYVAEFNRDVNTLANNHTGYDEGRIIYVDYEGESANQSNYWDILAVYMVKHGVGDTTTILTPGEWLNNEYIPNNQDKAWIKEVSSKATKQAIMNGEKAFKKFFNGEGGFPKFKKKKSQDVKAYFPKNNKTDWTIERHRIKIPTLGFIRLKEFGYIPVNSVVKS